MSSTVSAKISPVVSLAQTPTSGPLNGTTLNLSPTLALTLSAGTGAADLCDRVYYGLLTFVASTPQTLDLTTLTDVLGNAVNFTRVRAIVIQNQSTVNGVTLTVGNAGANEWDAVLSASGTLGVSGGSPANPNGGFYVQTCPNTTGWVVDGTHKALKLDPGAAAFTAVVILVGSST
jgi:hypothetical protein